MFHVPNQFRVRTHPELGTDDSAGNNGTFSFEAEGYKFLCAAVEGAEWENVSVQINRSRQPDQEQLLFIRSLFWDDDDIVVFFLPAPKNYTPIVQLWRSKKFKMITPPLELIGVASKRQNLIIKPDNT